MLRIRNKLSFLENLAYFCIGVLFVYLQAHYLFGGDSAEYTLAARTFSIPHPPGYPFYTLLGNIVTRVFPVGSGVWSLSLLSSIPTILTAMILKRIIFFFTHHEYIAFTSSIVFLFLYPVMLYALVPEVFALNTFLVTLLIYIAIRYNQTNLQRYAYIFYGIVGLCLAHHYIFALTLPGIFFLVERKKRFNFFFNDIFKKIVCVIPGLLFYIYPVISSLHNPPIDWENAKTLQGLIRLITRSSYGTFSAYIGATPNALNQIFDSISSIIYAIKDFKLIGIVLIGIGVIYIMVKQNKYKWFLLMSIGVIIFFVYYANYSLGSVIQNAVFERFVILLYLYFCIAYAWGLLLIENILLYITLSFHKLTKNIIRIGFIIFVTGIPVAIALQTIPVMSTVRTNRYFDQFARNILSIPDKNAIVFTRTDTAYFTTQYMYEYEKVRPDLHFIYISLLNRDYFGQRVQKRYPDTYMPSLKLSAPDFYDKFITENAKRHPIYVESPMNIGQWVPYGLLWKYFPDKKAVDAHLTDIIAYNELYWKRNPPPQFSKTDLGILHVEYLKIYYQSQINSFIRFLVVSNQLSLANLYIQKFQSYLTESSLNTLNSFFAVQSKQCRPIMQFLPALEKTQILMLSYEDLTLILKSYGLCDPNNPKVTGYLQRYHELKTSELSL